jgi:RimJ/RimL family protein N-acetyltransferase
MLRIRPVTDQDARLLWEWVNEPGARASAFRSDPIPWEEHLAWFGRKAADRRCRMYVIEADGRPAGQVRFDIDDAGQAEVDISIAADCRGRGYGAEALRLACARVLADGQPTKVVAHIKPHNVASARAFARAGFVAERSRRADAGDPVRMTLSLQGDR